MQVVKWFLDFLSKSISRLCPDLRIIEFEGNISLRQSEGSECPLVKGSREMRVEQLESSGISTTRLRMNVG